MQERKRLELQERERREFANVIISQTSDRHQNGPQGSSANMKSGLKFDFGMSAPKNKFGRKDDSSSREERLNELLEKIEQYTKFILNQNFKHHKSKLRQQ